MINIELWVRSQDKLMLLKVDAFTIHEEPNNKKGFAICDGYTAIGWYKSKERALEVLDEIQPLLKSKVLLNSGKILGSFEDTIYREPDKVEIQELNTIVYEMPKE